MTVSPVSMQSDEQSLIRQSLLGDDKAFRRLMSQYLPLVYNYLYRMTQNADLSEEVTQETFVKAYNHLKSFDIQRPFRPWLLRIASNAAVSELRKQSRVVSLNALEEDGQWSEKDYQPAADNDMLTRLERQLSSEEVMKVLEKLDVKYQQVLILRYQHELSYEEISEALNIPLNTVRTWLKRGLEKLKDQVKEVMPYD